MSEPETRRPAGADGAGTPSTTTRRPGQTGPRRVVVRREKSLMRDMESLQEWCGRLGVSAEKAEAVYRQAVKAGILRGRYAKEVVAASMYVAARHSDHPITIMEAAEATGERLRNVRRAAILVGKEVGLPPQDVWKYIERGVQRLNLPPGDWSLVDLGNIRTELGAPRRAGIALYIASYKFGSPRSIEEVAEALGLNANVLRHYVGKKGMVKSKAVVR